MKENEHHQDDRLGGRTAEVIAAETVDIHAVDERHRVVAGFPFDHRVDDAEGVKERVGDVDDQQSSGHAWRLVALVPLPRGLDHGESLLQLGEIAGSISFIYCDGRYGAFYHPRYEGARYLAHGWCGWVDSVNRDCRTRDSLWTCAIPVFRG